jgi:hypothetical protein
MKYQTTPGPELRLMTLRKTEPKLHLARDVPAPEGDVSEAGLRSGYEAP